jgi:hypothetical protein
MIETVSVRISRQRLKRAVVRGFLAARGYSPKRPAPLFAVVRAQRAAEVAVRRVMAEVSERGIPAPAEPARVRPW